MSIVLWFLAFIAVSMAFGTWLGFRLSEESHRMDDLTAWVLTAPLPDEDTRP